MFILDTISNLCTDPGLANIITIIKKVVNVIWIVGPILAIISAVITAIKLMSNPDEKKYKSLLKNCIMALLFLFIIPIFVNAVMALFDDTFEVAACWNKYEEISSNGQTSEYIDKNDKKTRSKILIDPDEYKTGEKPEESIDY